MGYNASSGFWEEWFLDTIKGKGRQRWYAFVLSLFLPGAGHFYLGKVRRARMIFGLLIACYAGFFIGVPLVYIMCKLLFLGLWLYALIGLFVVPVARPQKPAVYQTWWFSLMLVLGWRLGLAALFFLVTPTTSFYSIPTTSMAPSLNVGEWIIVDQRAYMSEPPKRGDIIIFRFPQRPDEIWVKRVVGLPGETLREFNNGRLYINRKEITMQEAEIEPFQPYIDLLDISDPSFSVTPYFENLYDAKHAVFLREASQFAKSAHYTVPEDAYFVMGDNRGFSYDSRDWGAVPAGNVVGKVYGIVIPKVTWSRFGYFLEWGQNP